MMINLTRSTPKLLYTIKTFSCSFLIIFATNERKQQQQKNTKISLDGAAAAVGALTKKIIIIMHRKDSCYFLFVVSFSLGFQSKSSSKHTFGASFYAMKTQTAKVEFNFKPFVMVLCVCVYVYVQSYTQKIVISMDVKRRKGE